MDSMVRSALKTSPSTGPSIGRLALEDRVMLSATPLSLASVPNSPPHFGNGTGSVVFDLLGDSESGAVTLQSDGKILMTGGLVASNDAWLVRYHADGSLDQGFGNNGYVQVSIGVQTTAATDVLVQPDGKIVIAGTTRMTNDDAFVMRFHSDGSQDLAFGNNGLATFDTGGDNSIRKIALQSDGRIVAVGYSEGESRVANVLRILPNGDLDQTFATDGIVDSELGLETKINDLEILSDGGILAAGDKGIVDSDLLLAKLLPDGSLDASFGAGGIEVVDFGNSATTSALAVQQNGRIIVSQVELSPGVSGLVAGFETNGRLDSSFGNMGVEHLGTFRPISLALGSQDQIYLSGIDQSNFTGQIHGLTSLGDYLVGFGASGIQSIGLFGSSTDLAVQVDGRVLQSGTFANGMDQHAVISRHQVDGNLDSGFGLGVSGSLDGTVGYVEGGPPVVLDRDVEINDAELDALNGGMGNYSGAEISINRSTGPNSEDQFSISNGSVITFDGVNVLKNGVLVGALGSSVPGQLNIFFHDANGVIPTSDDVDQLLQQITYQNTSVDPPEQIEVVWRFRDGDASDPSTREALGVSRVTIMSVNSAPRLQLNNQVVAVAENTNSTGGFRVADLEVIDDREGDNRLVLDGVHADQFEIVGNQLFLKSSVELNYEEITELNVSIGVEDLTLGSDPFSTIDYQLSVTDVNESPVATPDSYFVGDTDRFDLDGLGVLINDFDEDGDSLVSIATSSPQNGSLILDQSGGFTYVPNPGFSGADVFTYQVFDGELWSSPVTVSLVVSRSDVIPDGGGGNGNGDDGEVEGGAQEEANTTDPENPGFGEVAVDASLLTSTLGDELKQSKLSVRTPSQNGLYDEDANSSDEVTNVKLVLSDSKKQVHVGKGIQLPSETHSAPRGVGESEVLAFSHLPHGMTLLSPIHSVESSFASTERYQRLVVGTTAFTSTAVSLGYIFWLARGSSLCASVMSALPTWTAFDPLPVVNAASQIEDTETLATIVESSVGNAGLVDAGIQEEV